METISNVASAASKAIFGENNPQAATQGNETQGQEPISGQQGKGTVNEPFDQGNSENPTTVPSTASTTDKTSSNLTGTTTNKDHSSGGTTLDYRSSSGLPSTSTTDKASSGSINPTEMSDSQTPNNPTNVAAGGEPNPLSNTDKTGVAGGDGEPRKGQDIVPSERSENPGAAPSSGGGAEFKQQGADKPNAEPSAEPSEEDILKKRDPNDHSGEPMRVHGGDEVPGTQEERRESKVGMPGGQEHGKEPKGTGEKVEHVTGFAADGGDFDATKAGAGSEGNRLLEEKGIHKSDKGVHETEPGQSTSASAEEDSSKDKEKKPLSEKIKEKLHIGHSK